MPVALMGAGTGQGAEGARSPAQPAKTALFAGVKAPGLRRNFLRPNKSAAK
jgi:hypothetical protein